MSLAAGASSGSEASDRGRGGPSPHAGVARHRSAGGGPAPPLSVSARISEEFDVSFAMGASSGSEASDRGHGQAVAGAEGGKPLPPPPSSVSARISEEFDLSVAAAGSTESDLSGSAPYVPPLEIRDSPPGPVQHSPAPPARGTPACQQDHSAQHRRRSGGGPMHRTPTFRTDSNTPDRVRVEIRRDHDPMQTAGPRWEQTSPPGPPPVRTPIISSPAEAEALEKIQAAYRGKSVRQRSGQRVIAELQRQIADMEELKTMMLSEESTDQVLLRRVSGQLTARKAELADKLGTPRETWSLASKDHTAVVNIEPRSPQRAWAGPQWRSTSRPTVIMSPPRLDSHDRVSFDIKLPSGCLQIS